jgi:hypothetical protein
LNGHSQSERKIDMPKRADTTTPVHAFETWPTTPTHPTNPTVTLFFGGLLDVCYKKLSTTSGVCEIAVNPSDPKHKLILLAQSSSGQTLFDNNDPPRAVKDISLKVLNRPALVNFLKTGGDDLDRDNGPDGDFRWMLDLEGPDFYKENYPKRPVFKTKMTVANGTILTTFKSEATFDRVSVLLGSAGVSPRSVGHIALVMEADIELSQNETAVLTVDGLDVPMPWAPNTTYQISYGNICVDNNANCTFDPGSIIESRRNDFAFHRDVLDLPTFRARYGLRLREPGDPIAHPKIAGFPFVPWGTDKAPCMDAGFGQTDGFP